MNHMNPFEKIRYFATGFLLLYSAAFYLVLFVTYFGD